MTDTHPLGIPLGFAGGGLARHAERRGTAEALFRHPRARVLAMWQGRPLVAGPAETPQLAWLPATTPLPVETSGPRLYLGDDTGPLFGVDMSAWNPEGGEDPGPGRVGEDCPAPPGLADPDAPDASGARFADLRGLVTKLPPRDAEIAATVRGLFEWHRTHGFCATCGTRSAPEHGGWQRRCPACGRLHFPRTDPVVIMLVTLGNHALIGRSPGWPEGFHSLLAGFMEPGETIEAAVRREVAEETGVAIGQVRLLTSQPWPFPASLMIGCIAEATSRAITLDPAELDAAFWITREDLLAVFAGQTPGIRIPTRGTIAGHLMHLWLADRLD